MSGVVKLNFLLFCVIVAVATSSNSKDIQKLASVDPVKKTPLLEAVDTFKTLQQKTEETLAVLETLVGVKQAAGKSEGEIETVPKQHSYDEHFNCIKNCDVDKNISSSCDAATAANQYSESIYLLILNVKDLTPFYVYCKFRAITTKRSWMIIQRRKDGSENFYRNWNDYKHGFGNLYNEYWIGLERLYKLTKGQDYQLWIQLSLYNNTIFHIRYSKFSVSSELDGYRLSLGGFSGMPGMNQFQKHNNHRFSTFDHDNDKTYMNCAQEETSGWWFGDCSHCNLNGPYYSVSNKNTSYGIYWFTEGDVKMNRKLFSDSLRYVHMGIYPVQKST